MPTPLDSFAGLLAALRGNGSLPSSRARGKNFDRLRPLLDAGVLIENRVGAGKAITLIDIVTLDKFIAHEYPAGLFGNESESADLDRRTLALTRYRDSKAMGRLDFEIVEFRLMGNHPLQIGVHTLRGSSMPPSGLGALVLHDHRHADFPLVSFAGRVATVENPTVFISYPWTSEGIDLAILTYGRMSRRLVSWLSGESMHDASVTHFGDYDPVGLCEYLRIQEQLGDRANLFIPDNLDDLFRRYSNRELLTRSSGLLPRLEKSQHPDVLRVLALMRKHSGGLEHEVLTKKSVPLL
ncbi:MAG: hypothetical protein M0P95_18010 [Sulfuritalea sp.]|jgi:hypothetical protein|nr:hypothetical protein [Sulfuritalea sp.]